MNRKYDEIARGTNNQLCYVDPGGSGTSDDIISNERSRIDGSLLDESSLITTFTSILPLAETVNLRIPLKGYLNLINLISIQSQPKFLLLCGVTPDHLTLPQIHLQVPPS